MCNPPVAPRRADGWVDQVGKIPGPPRPPTRPLKIGLARLFGWGGGASARKASASHGHHIVSAQGIDLDSLEALMDRRFSSILRHTWLVTFLTLFLLAALIAGAIY